MTTFIPNSICTLANEFAIQDLQLFFSTIELWNTNLPDIYLFCDTKVSSWLSETKRYKGNLYTKEALNRYSGLSRKDMEQRRGQHLLIHSHTRPYRKQSLQERDAIFPSYFSSI